MLSKIFRAAGSEVALETQVEPCPGRFPRRQLDAQHLGDVHKERRKWPKASGALRGSFVGAHTADEMSLCLLTRTVHKLPIIGIAKLPAAGGTAASFKRL